MPRVLNNHKISSSQDLTCFCVPRYYSRIYKSRGSSRSLWLCVGVHAMTVNASRGCKHMSWCADEEQRVGSEIDLTRHAWISTDAYMQTTIFAFHTRCTLGTTWNSSMKAMEQLKDRSQCVNGCAVRSLALCFNEEQRCTRAMQLLVTVTQRKWCFVNAKSFPLKADSHELVWFLYQCMSDRRYFKRNNFTYIESM